MENFLKSLLSFFKKNEKTSLFTVIIIKNFGNVNNEFVAASFRKKQRGRRRSRRAVS